MHTDKDIDARNELHTLQSIFRNYSHDMINDIILVNEECCPILYRVSDINFLELSFNTISQIDSKDQRQNLCNLVLTNLDIALMDFVLH